ncbi:MAG: map [Segetibacter sp.]|nr:map [Segetibacter sp.]
MPITTHAELAGIKKISEAVAITLKEMREYARPGMTAKALDDFGGSILKNFGANSAPKLSYNFPGWTCISTNNEVAHGIPSENKILQEGDLVNIDVSAELEGFWSDNGGSFVLGEDINNHNVLVKASKSILFNAIRQIKGGVKIADIGRFIEMEAKKSGYRVIRNLTGHGVGRSLHEEPYDIACYYDKSNVKRFRKNSIVAVETFISTKSTNAIEISDGWTLAGQNGGFVAQHEHTIMVTDSEPIILTEANQIWN